ncbi:MAG: tetratricopeptide repeat protein [Ignavibacteria bacterium]|nr:tetratricopeptide repeat protein [Ignavibacteria bacterium]
MDLLKNFKKLLIIVAVFVIATGINAQKESIIPYDDVQNAFKLSYKYESEGNISAAIDALKNVYIANNYEINLRLGWLYYLNKQYSESMNYYKIAMNLMPYAIEPKLGYVYPLSAVEDWDKVADTYLEILKIDPNNTFVMYRLGLIYYYKPDYQKAYNYFEKVVNLYPFDYYSNLMLAWTNYQLGKGKEAEVLFKKVLLISPDDASALEGLNLLKK